MTLDEFKETFEYIMVIFDSPITLYGYTFSWLNVFIWAFFATLAVAVLSIILKWEVD